MHHEPQSLKAIDTDLPGPLDHRLNQMGSSLTAMDRPSYKKVLAPKISPVEDTPTIKLEKGV